MTSVSIRRLSKRFAGQTDAPALYDLSIDIHKGQFFTLLGPSGCGKSTLLRCIAGLETADEGEIRIGGDIVFSADRRIDVPPNKRRIGMVFQSYAIWPHMTVIQNVAFPLETKRVSRPRPRAMEALALVGLEAFADRLASKLSGGQQQRVALARAIVAEPALLLLDEPLSNLDAALREQMRAELQNLQRRLRMTTVYVTHDQVEALSLSDAIAVIRAGALIEIAPPRDLYQRPRSAFSARFVGGANVLSGHARSAPGGAVVETPFGMLEVNEGVPDGERMFFVRPEHIRVLSCRPPNSANVFACQIVSRRFVGEATEFDLVLGGDKTMLCARTAEPPPVEPEGRVWISFDPSAIHFLDRD